MNNQQPDPPSWQDRKRQQTVKLAIWTGAWLLSMALATFGPQFLWAGNKLATVIATAVNVLVGFRMILANRDLLRTLDELEQRVHFDAMAITLGIGLVVGLAYSNLDTSNVIAFDAEISHVVMIMGLSYLTSMLLLMRRYR